MTVWAVLMVKDEADVIGGTLAHLANEGVDGFVVADNGSTDGTDRLIDDFARQFPGPVLALDDPDPAYRQSEKMTALAQLAHERGADWVVPVDADELWGAGVPLADALAAVPDEVRVVGAAMWNHFPTALDEDDPDPFRSIVWRQTERNPLDKACCRWRPGMVIDQGNHAVSENGRPMPGHGAGLNIRHFPYRSWEQFRRKAVNGAAAYAASDLPPEMGAHWRGYGRILEAGGDDALRAVYETWFWFADPAAAGMTYDPAPYRRW